MLFHSLEQCPFQKRALVVILAIAYSSAAAQTLVLLKIRCDTILEPLLKLQFPNGFNK